MASDDFYFSADGYLSNMKVDRGVKDTLDKDECRKNKIFGVFGTP